MPENEGTCDILENKTSVIYPGDRPPRIDWWYWWRHHWIALEGGKERGRMDGKREEGKGQEREREREGGREREGERGRERQWEWEREGEREINTQAEVPPSQFNVTYTLHANVPVFTTGMKTLISCSYMYFTLNMLYDRCRAAIRTESCQWNGALAHSTLTPVSTHPILSLEMYPSYHLVLIITYFAGLCILKCWIHKYTLFAVCLFVLKKISETLLNFQNSLNLRPVK